MEQIIRIYGKMLLEIITVMLLILFLFYNIQDEEGNRGIFKIVGAQITVESTDYHTYSDFGMYLEESKKEYPVITFDAGRSICRGTFFVSDYAKATDYADRDIRLEVRSILDPAGNENLDTYNKETMEASIPVPGVYVMEVSATDQENRKTVCTIRIPVN